MSTAAIPQRTMACARDLREQQFHETTWSRVLAVPRSSHKAGLKIDLEVALPHSHAKQANLTELSVDKSSSNAQAARSRYERALNGTALQEAELS